MHAQGYEEIERARNWPGSLDLGELLLRLGRLLGARLGVALVLLRRLRRLDFGGARRDGLLVFVAHAMNPFMKDLKTFSRLPTALGVAKAKRK